MSWEEDRKQNVAMRERATTKVRDFFAEHQADVEMLRQKYRELSPDGNRSDDWMHYIVDYANVRFPRTFTREDNLIVDELSRVSAGDPPVVSWEEQRKQNLAKRERFLALRERARPKVRKFFAEHPADVEMLRQKYRELSPWKTGGHEWFRYIVDYVSLRFHVTEWDDILSIADELSAIVLSDPPSSSIQSHDDPRFALRRCPQCTGPNDFLEWASTSAPHVDAFVLWFQQPSPFYLHTYRCRRCGYECQWESPSADPDLGIRNHAGNRPRS